MHYRIDDEGPQEMRWQRCRALMRLALFAHDGGDFNSELKAESQSSSGKDKEEGDSLHVSTFLGVDCAQVLSSLRGNVSRENSQLLQRASENLHRMMPPVYCKGGTTRIDLRPLAFSHNTIRETTSPGFEVSIRLSSSPTRNRRQRQ